MGTLISPAFKNGFTPSESEGQTKGEQTTAPPQTDQIPSTGPAEVTFMLLGGSALVGILARSVK